MSPWAWLLWLLNWLGAGAVAIIVAVVFAVLVWCAWLVLRAIMGGAERDDRGR